MNKNYILAIVALGDGETAYCDFIATSSAEYSKQIAKILETGHNDCQRVEQAFRIPNAVERDGKNEIV